MSELVYPFVVDVSGRTFTPDAGTVVTLSDLVDLYGFRAFTIPVHPDELTQLISIVDGSNSVYDFSAIAEAVHTAESNMFSYPNQVLVSYMNSRFPWRAENQSAQWSYAPFEPQFTAFTNAESTSDSRASILEQLDSNARYLVGPSQEYATFQSFTLVTDISFSTSLSIILPPNVNVSTFMLTPKPAIQQAMDTLSGGRCIFTFTAGERTDQTIQLQDVLYNTVSDSLTTRGNIVAQLRRTISDGRETIILFDGSNVRYEFPFVTLSGRQTLSSGTYYLSTNNTFTILDMSSQISATLENQEIMNQPATLEAIQTALGQSYDFFAYTITISDTGLPYSGYFTASAYLLAPGGGIMIYLDGTPIFITNTGVYTQLIGANDSNTYFIYNINDTTQVIDETTADPLALLVVNGSYATTEKTHYVTLVDVFDGNSSVPLTYNTSAESQWDSLFLGIYSVNQSNVDTLLSPEYGALRTAESDGKGGITYYDTFTYPANMFYATLEHTTVQMSVSYDITVDATGLGGSVYAFSVSGTTQSQFWNFTDIRNYRGSNVAFFGEALPISTVNRLPEPLATYTLATLDNSYDYVVDSNTYTVYFSNETYGDTNYIYRNDYFWNTLLNVGNIDLGLWRFTRPNGTHLTYFQYTPGYENAVEPGYLTAEHRVFTAEPINILYFILDFTTGTFTGQFYVGVNDPAESVYTFLPSNITLPETYELQNNNGDVTIYTSNDAFNPPAGVYKLYPTRTHFTYLYSGNTTFTGFVPGSQNEFVNTLMGFDTPGALSNVVRITDTATSEDVTDIVEGGTYILTTSYSVVVDGSGIGLTTETVPITVSGFMDAWDVALNLNTVFNTSFGYPTTLLYAGRTHLPIPDETFTLSDFLAYTFVQDSVSNTVRIFTGAGQYQQGYWYTYFMQSTGINYTTVRLTDQDTGIQYVYRPAKDSTSDAIPPTESTLLIEQGVTTIYYITDDGTNYVYVGVVEGEDPETVLLAQIDALGGTPIQPAEDGHYIMYVA